MRKMSDEMKLMLLKDQIDFMQADLFPELYAFDRLGVNPFEDTVNRLVGDLLACKKEMDAQTEFVANITRNKDKLVIDETYDFSELWEFLDDSMDTFGDDFADIMRAISFRKYREKIAETDDYNEKILLNVLSITVSHEFIHYYLLDAFDVIPFEDQMVYFKAGLLYLHKSISLDKRTKHLTKQIDRQLKNFNRVKEDLNIYEATDWVYALITEDIPDYSEALEEIVGNRHTRLRRL